MPTMPSTLSRPPAHGRPRVAKDELIIPEALRAEGPHACAQVLRERARIAREIHDILAHTLGSLFVQLDAAEALLDQGHGADQSRPLVTEAKRLAAAGLAETHQAIAGLRAGPALLPEALAALSRRDGHVSQEVSGRPRQLRPDASLALYRAGQEALANARKHAPGAPVAMTLRFEEEAAVLRVVNPLGRPADSHSPSPAATGPGYGLQGLKERADLLGGTLRAGPGDGGWVVELRVPA
jgi:signal transduction histidine kinase